MKKAVPENCDNCVNYSWYYGHCGKWNCQSDGRSKCREFHSIEEATEKCETDESKRSDSQAG